MSSFADQIIAAKAAHSVVEALEQTARAQIFQVFTDWDAGKLTDDAALTKLQATVTASYNAASSIGLTVVANQAGLGTWTPQSPTNKDYLDALLADVRKNFTVYQESEKTDADRRNAVLRIQHSAGVGAEQGYTDAVQSGYSELDDFGYDLRKVWMANFVDNIPCPYCVKLHGTEVKIHQQFKHPASKKVYQSLYGPPLHPRCQCFLVVLIVSLDNADEELNVDAPSGHTPSTMTTDDVKSLPKKIFDALRRVLKAIAKAFKGKK